MLYIKIGNEKYPAKFHTFRTQANKEGIRVIGDCPTANGFLIVDDNDEVVFDRSDYTYLYRKDDKCKEYTKEYEEIIPTESFALGTPDNPFSALSRQISAVNNRVTEITPYTESKTAYIDDEYVCFDAKDGNVSVFMVDGEGQNVPFTFEQINGQIKVSFEKRNSLATVTVSIQ